MRVVFDTNTVVSALLFGGGLSWLDINAEFEARSPSWNGMVSEAEGLQTIEE